MNEPEGGAMVTDSAPRMAGVSMAGAGQAPTLRQSITSAYDAQGEKAQALDALDQIAQQTGNQQIAALVAILRKP